MAFIDNTCKEFIDVLATKAAVPGGGGASALVGAVGVALANMVCALTTGKKKYAEYEDDIQRIIADADKLREQMLVLVDKDAEVFEPLSKAYGIPKEDPERETIMESALKLACSVPMDIMRVSTKAIKLHEELAKKGSVLAISDVGVGVICCKTALMGASLNVFINTKSMTDRAYAAEIEKEADALLDEYCALADKIYAEVSGKLR